jgi:hypothetical protein
MRNFKQEVQEMDEEHRLWTERRQRLFKEWIETECPYKIGEVIIVPRKTYAYEGKQMCITSIFVTRVWKGFVWKVLGIVLKKDGSESKLSVNFEEKIP